MDENREFRMKVPVQVRFRDTDAMGHVNNAVYLSYLELARMEYWRTVVGVRDLRKLDSILARVEIDYRSPVQLGESLEVRIRVSELRGSSFEFEYRIHEAASGRLVAEARTVQACYDYKRGKVKRLDSDMRRAIAEFENDPALFKNSRALRAGFEEGGESA